MVSGLDLAQKQRLSAGVGGHSVAFGDELAPAIREAQATASDVIFGNVPIAWLRGAPQLRWVQLDSAGVNAYVGLNAGRDRPILVTNLHDFYGRAVAECALAGILAFYRQLPRLLVAQSRGEWVKPQVEPEIGQLHGASVIILGAGAICRCLARLLAPFEGSVRMFARTSDAAQLHTLGELDAVLATADVVINALPEAQGTIGILSAERLARMRASALIVNVGRGSAIDEAALLAALDGGRLGGAVLDVTIVEPLPAKHPFWNHPRVILTQHTGGRFPAEREGKIDRFLLNLGRFDRNEPLLGAVDLNRGY
ncbi:MAG: hydroxyacid dehydrogenase [Verrucomicrobia bacterium]|nr:hydroxyacid dehydrogenase [Verrucomicrobiota bacterium]